MDPAGNPQTSTAAHQTAGANSPQIQHMNGFSMISPNETRRAQAMMTAQKEENDLQRYRETQRAVYVQSEPQRLGGSGSMSEARQKQFEKNSQIPSPYSCKLQKKLKRIEQQQRRKQEEEAEIQEKKQEQRRKSERSEEKKELEQKRRKDQLHQHHFSVNSAFLDKLEVHRGLEVPTTGPQSSISAHLETHPESWTQETNQTPDNNKNLVSLMENFPDCSMGVLEEILQQCNGDYDSAFALLS